MRTKERQHQFDIAYMKMAIAFSELSYAKKRKVGALIVSKNDQVISQGFNGTPHGFPNCCEETLQDGTLKTLPEVLHAETNAISKCAKNDSSTKDGTIYITLSPCINCAKLIIQAELKRVIYLDDYKDMTGVELLKKCGIIVEKLKIN